jgi:hypothetical protein
MSTSIVTYINKETGKLEKLDTDSGEIFTPEQFYSPANKNKKYNLEDALKVCAMLRSGLPLIAIANGNGLPDVETLYSWKRHHPDFDVAMKEAREFAAESYAHKAISIADHANTLEKEQVPAAKLQVDTYKWMAEKMNPDLYGNRTKIAGDADQPLTIIVDTGIKR